MTGVPIELDPIDNYPGKTVQSRVYGVLKDAIANGRFADDSRIRQSEIATTLGVSVSPVREALRDLAADGYVSFDPHRGATVRSFDIEDFEEMIQIRLSLEPLRCRRLLEYITDEQLDEMRQVHDAIVREPASYLELNRDFHGVIAQACRSPRLDRIFNSLNDVSTMMMDRTAVEFPHRILEGISEHARILEAIEHKDIDTLISVMIAHNQSTWEVVKERMLAERAERDAAAGDVS